MFFPGIMPKRKASLHNPQLFTTIQTTRLRNLKLQVFTPESYTNKNRRLKTQASKSYRAKKSANSPQKTRAEFKSNLTSFYQRHLTCFDQQKQTIKHQKERIEVPEAKELSESKATDKSNSKLYFIVKRRKNLLNLSKRSKHDTINNLRNNKTEVISKQSTDKKEISIQKTLNTEKQTHKNKRYMELSLNEIFQADCPKWRYSPLKNKKNSQKNNYEGW